MNIPFFDESKIKKNPYTKLNVYCPLQPAHRHSFFEFVLVVHGTCQHSLNGQSRERLPQGTLLLIRPNEYHEIGFAGQDCTYRDYYVTAQDMEHICNSLDENFYQELVARETPYKIMLSVNELNTIIDKSAHFNNPYVFNENKTQLPQLHRAIITQLLGAFIEQTVPKKASIPDWLNTLHTHLTHFDYIFLSLDEIVQKTGYSHGYVCQMFKEYFHESLISIHNKNKVIYSCNLLGNMKIIDISCLLGWENPKNYALQFRKVFNYSPSVYLKMQRQSEKT